MSCGTAHKKVHRHHLSVEQKAKIAAALKGKHHKGHHPSLATRRKISEALKCHHALNGTCKPRKAGTAHSRHKHHLDKRHRLLKRERECKASLHHRHSRIGRNRNLTHQRRHMMRNVQRKAVITRVHATAHHRHLTGSRIVDRTAHSNRRTHSSLLAYHTGRRSQHKDRLHCHYKHRHSTGKRHTRPQCPKARNRRSRLDR